jgi:hypothetical protein
VNKQRIKKHQELSIQEQEYFKDIWDVRVFGVTPRIETYEYKISFKKIQQQWLKSATKAYARYALTVLSFGTVSHTIIVVNQLSIFINERHKSLQPNQINRQLIVIFLAKLAEIYPNLNSRHNRISRLNSFLEVCRREKWLDISNEILIYKQDFNTTLTNTIKSAREELVLSAIEALKIAMNTKVIQRPGGWLNNAIKDGWKPNENHLPQEQGERDIFKEWFDLAYKQRLVLASTSSLSNIF